MPIRDFVCKKCNYMFERLVRNGEVPECDRCHSKELEVQIARSGTFVLKGQGWYKDGYSGESNKR